MNANNNEVWDTRNYEKNDVIEELLYIYFKRFLFRFKTRINLYLITTLT